MILSRKIPPPIFLQNKLKKKQPKNSENTLLGPFRAGFFLLNHKKKGF
jgi:hypothetical protein